MGYKFVHVCGEGGVSCVRVVCEVWAAAACTRRKMDCSLDFQMSLIVVMSYYLSIFLLLYIIHVLYLLYN